jgi:hypothetical protein
MAGLPSTGVAQRRRNDVAARPLPQGSILQKDFIQTFQVTVTSTVSISWQPAGRSRIL